jgi:putative ABC transport system substrate-binding protein
LVGVGATAPPESSWQELRASQILIVFNVGSDPVRHGLVASFNRPGGTFTGVNSLDGELTGKILGLMHELLPRATTIGMILNRRGGSVGRDAPEAAATTGMQVFLLDARSESEIENAFAMLNERRADAIHVAVSPFFVTRARLFATLAARYKVPAVYARREFAEAGGLMSYGYDVADTYRQMGSYAGRILRGEKAGDLPVFQPTKLELVINLKTAKALGLTIPETLLATADEVIQ